MEIGKNRNIDSDADCSICWILPGETSKMRAYPYIVINAYA